MGFEFLVPGEKLDISLFYNKLYKAYTGDYPLDLLSYLSTGTVVVNNKELLLISAKNTIQNEDDNLTNFV